MKKLSNDNMTNDFTKKSFREFEEELYCCEPEVAEKYILSLIEQNFDMTESSIPYSIYSDFYEQVTYERSIDTKKFITPSDALILLTSPRINLSIDFKNKLEKIISRRASHSRRYAEHIGGEFLSGEEAISRSAKQSFYYASFLGKRFLKGEKTTANHPNTSIALRYANEVIKGRFELAEENILNSELFFNSKVDYLVSNLQEIYPCDDRKILKSIKGAKDPITPYKLKFMKKIVNESVNLNLSHIFDDDELTKLFLQYYLDKHINHDYNCE